MEKSTSGGFDTGLTDSELLEDIVSVGWGSDGLLYAVGRSRVVYAIEVAEAETAAGDPAAYSGVVRWEQMLAAPFLAGDDDLSDRDIRQALGLIAPRDSRAGHVQVTEAAARSDGAEVEPASLAASDAIGPARIGLSLASDVTASASRSPGREREREREDGSGWFDVSQLVARAGPTSASTGALPNGADSNAENARSRDAAEVSVADVAVGDGPGTATITFSLSEPVAEGPVTVPFTVTSGEATAAGEVVFDGVQTATAIVEIDNHGETELDEGLTVTIDSTDISAPDGVSVTGSGAANVATAATPRPDALPDGAGIEGKSFLQALRENIEASADPGPAKAKAPLWNAVKDAFSETENSQPAESDTPLSASMFKAEAFEPAATPGAGARNVEDITFSKFDLVLTNGQISGGASALQWASDGLLYAVGRNGFVYAIEVDKQTDQQGETTGYTGEILWTHDLSTPNFDDVGDFVNSGNRQALGIAVTEDAVTGETVIYVSHSDIKIGAGGGGGSGDVNLDTNSGVVTRIKVEVGENGLGETTVTENEALDLIRGLPRSEENHATNGLALTVEDGVPMLLIASGGHANAGAPSVNFVGLPEYTYSAAILSADLNKLAEIEAAKKAEDPTIDHVFDMPTLDDPTRTNFTDAGGDVWIDANFDGVVDSVAEFVDENADDIPDWMVDQDGDSDVDADDVADFVATKIVDADGDGVRDTILYQDDGSATDNVTGVRGGNDGLNQAKLLVGNPVQIYSSGYRNTYDVLVTSDGKKYTYDNGANGGWGGVAVTDPVTGLVTNEPNNVNQTQNFDQLHEFDQGTHSGHPNPSQASGSGAGLWTSPTTGPGSSTTLPIDDWRELSDTPLPSIGQEDDGLVLPADWDQLVDPELINPAAGVYNEGGSVADGALDSDKGSWNGLAEYTGTAFNGALQGAILVTQTGGDVKWIQRDQFGNIAVVGTNGSLTEPNTIVEAANQGLVGDTGGGNTLGIDAVGDAGVDGLGKFNNTIWVGSLGGTHKIEIFEAGGEPAGADLDKDDDGIDHVQDYYEFSDSQGVGHQLDIAFGTTTTVNAGETRTYTLSAESYPLSAPGGIGQLGYMVNLVDPSAEGGLLTADENVIPGGAGSALQIKDIRSGTAKGSANDQRDALTFAVTPGDDAGRLEISTVMVSILEGFYQDGSEAGLQIGTGDQFSFMSLVLAYSDSGTPALSMELHYEDADQQQATQSVDISDLLTDVDGLQRLPASASVELLFDVDTISGLVTPKFKVVADTQNPPADFTEMTPVQATGNVLDALQGQFVANGEPHPLAFGNIGTSAIDPSAPAGATEEDNVNVSYDEFKVVGFAPQVDAFVVLTGADATVIEDAGTLTLTLELQDEFGTPVTLGEDVVIAYTLGGEAQVPDDATVAPVSPITIASGTSSATVTITIEDDDLVEGTETLDVALGTIFANGLAVQAKAGADAGTITITDNDVPDPGSVLYRVNAGTATNVASVDSGPDWLGDANLIGDNATGITLSGNTSDTFTQGLTDQESEMDLSNLVSPVPWQLFVNERGDNNTATPTLDYAFDVTPGASYTVTLYYVENWNNIFTAPNRIFDVSLEGSVPPEFDDIHPLREATDYLDGEGAPLPSGSLTNAEKQPYLGTAFSKSVTYTATDDTLNLSFLHNSQNPKINAIEISVADPGTGGSVAVVSVADVTVDEGDGTATVTFSLSAPVTEGAVTIPFTVTNGSAEAGSDFTAPTTLEVVFDGSQTATATFDLTDDPDVEGTEDFTVAIDGAGIVAPSEATVTASGSASTATVTILDNDVTPPADGEVLYRVNAGGPTIVVGADDATTPSDPDLDWSADTAGANNPNLLSAGSNNTSGYSVTPGASVPASVPAELFLTERWDDPVDPSMQWGFAVADGTYVVNLYMGNGFNGTNAAGTRVFDVAIEGAVPQNLDDIDLSGQLGHLTGGVFSHTVEVTDGQLDIEFLHNVENPLINAIEIVATDDDPAQDVTITAQDIAADESTGEITITFTISEAVAGGDITVPFTLVSGTADVTTDLTPSQDGTITFPAGDGSDQTVVITLVNDDLVEDDETFTVQLGTPTEVPVNVNVTTVDGTATILDEDVAPVVDSFNGTPATGDDWSDDNTAPDDVTLTEGTNTLVSTGANGDADYITFTVAAGQQVTAITLADYAGGGNSAFLGIQQGESVPTEAEIAGGTATLDGGTVYNVAQEGQDILPLLASTSVENAGQPTTGLTTPLQAGTYTLWFNQNQDLTETTLEIVSEAVPGADPTDIDGDGILNTDDPFAYDGANGDAKVLTAGAEFTQDFDTDTTDPFSPDGGFSGILVNPAFDYGNPADPAADPYGNRTNEAGVSISGGTLSILSTETDAFSTGTGTNNTLADAYQSAVDVSGATSFEVHARASSAEWLGATAFNGFAQFGITLGAGGVDDFVKLVLSDAGNNAPRVQIAHNQSLVGGNDNNYPVNSSTGPTIDLALIGDVEFRLIVDKAAGTVVGQVDFFAAADGALLESFTTPAATILADSSLEAALNGENPLTNGDGGLAYGVVTSDWNAGADNRITANYDFLTVRSLDAPTDAAPTAVTLENVVTLPENTNTTAAVKVADIVVEDDGESTVVLTLAGTAADVALFEIVGTELFLNAGVALDFETQNSFDVSVVATDAVGSAASTPLGEIVTDSDIRDLPAADDPSGLPDGEDDGTDEIDTVEYTGTGSVGTPLEPYELPSSVENFDATGTGQVNVKGTSANNVIGVGSGDGDTVDLTDGGSDTVTGTGSELDNTTIAGFGTDDQLVVENADPSATVIEVTPGSTILGLDTTGDGAVDTTVTLEEDYAPDEIVGTVVDGSLVITAVPAPTTFTTTLQAGDLTINDVDDDSTVRSPSNPEDNQTGTGKADGIWINSVGDEYLDLGNDTGDGAEFTYNALNAATGTLTFRYANGSTADRPIIVFVNGVAQGTLPFAPTAEWFEWDEISIEIDLVAGANVVSFSQNQANGPNIDQIVLETEAEPADDTPPVFDAAPATASVQENTAGVVADFDASDADGQAVAYSLAGDDAAAFAIDAATGELSFDPAPDFEAPTDTGGDNVYDVDVVATAGGLSVSSAIQVTVEDLPSINSGNVEDGDTGIGLQPSFTFNFAFVDGVGVDELTITTDTVKLIEVGTGDEVPSSVNGSGGNDALAITPQEPLDPNTAYQIVVDGVLDLDGRPLEVFTAGFTTGDDGGTTNPLDPAFIVNSEATIENVPVTSLEISPDGQHLYAASIAGTLYRWDIDPADGTLSNQTTYDGLAGKAVIGIAFDPNAPNDLWLTSNLPIGNEPDFTGEIVRLTLDDQTTAFDGTLTTMVTGLPRSVSDHLSNSIEFNVAGEMFMVQGSNTASGAADNVWGNRDERLLSAATLKVDHTAIAALVDGGAPAYDVTTDVQDFDSGQGGEQATPADQRDPDGSVPGFYNPFADGALVTIHATGIRNAYDLVWHSNGFLYVPTNGTGSQGNVPDDPSTAFDESTVASGSPKPDLLFKSDADGGEYFGHPNPTRGEYIAFGGNPTSGSDPQQINSYPVGTSPDENFTEATFDFGNGKSPNGSVEFTSDVFNGALKGALLTTRFSGGDDIFAFQFDENGDVISQTALKDPDGNTIIFSNPLDVVTDASGRIYVIEYQRGNPFASSIKLLTPDAPPVATAEIEIGGLTEVATDDRIVFSGVDTVEAGTATADIANVATVTVSNTGTEDLVVSGIGVTGEFELADPTQASGFTVTPGSSVDVTVTFTAATKGVFTGELTINSNDADEGVKAITLAGYNQPVLEGGQEPSVDEILQVFGYTTDLGGLASRDGDDGAAGDEVISAYWESADGGAVTVTQLAAYTGPRDYAIQWFDENPAATGAGDLTINTIFAHAQSDSHTLLPDSTENDGPARDPATGSFNPTGPFGFSIFWNGDTDYTDPTFQTQDKGATGNVALPGGDILMRMFQLRDADGNVVPNTYLLFQDYQAVNFDWNDNVYLVENVAPAGTVADTAPTAQVVVTDPADANGDLVVTVTFDDDNAIDDATVEQSDLTLAGPGTPSAVAFAYDEATDTATWTYSAPAEGWADGDYTATLQADSVSDDAGQGVAEAAATTALDFTPVVPGDLIAAINVGSTTDYTRTSDGTVFVADPGPTTESGPSEVRNKPELDFEGTEDDVLYQTYRFAENAPTASFTYSFNVPNGTYIVYLYLAETFQTSTGQRSFDIAAEGELIADDLDLAAAFGPLVGTTGTAGILEREVTVTDGVLDLSFLDDQIDNALVNAIEVRKAAEPDAVPTAQVVVTEPADVNGDLVVTVTLADDNGIDDATVAVGDLLLSGPSTPGVPTFSYDNVNDVATWTYAAPAGGWANGDYTATLQADSVSDDAGQGVAETTGTATIDVTPVAPGDLIAAINVGGDEYVRGSDGTVFAADPGPSSEVFASETNTRPAMTFNETEDDDLYRDYRFSSADQDIVDGDAFTYSIDVPQTGTYDVTLYIAEIFFEAAGLRVFDILAEGNLIEDDLDPAAVFGPVVDGTSGTSTAGTIEFEIEVTDGTLDLEFADGPTNNALVSAIEVRAAEVVTPVSSAAIGVTEGGSNIDASTFNNSSFTIENTGETAITQVVFDLASGVLPDIVFDPDGTAGDATAKGFTPDGGSGTTTGATASFGDPNEGGFYTLTIDFSDFQPGETLTFGLDTDPTSVQGQSAPGTGESGSVSGLEMVGTGVSISFDDGSTLTSSLFEDGSNAGATAVVAKDAPAAPTIALVGGSSFSTVNTAAQMILITGTPGATVRLLQVEGAMFEPTEGGFDVEPFEANSIIGREAAFTGTLDSNGELMVPVTLTDVPQTVTDGTAVTGLNHFVAVVDGAGGQTSATSNTLVVEYDADFVEPGGAAALIEVTPDSGLDASTDSGPAFQITNTGPAKISSISFDVSTAILPDMVFDPQANMGGAGLGLSPVAGATDTGYIAPADPTGEVGGGSSGTAFLEQNGIVVIEMESGSFSDSWEDAGSYDTVFSPNVNDPAAATGDDFIIWQAGQNLGNPGTGLITYEVEITEAGTYQFQWRNQVGNGTNATEHNDTWLKIEADQFYGSKNGGASIVQPKGAAPGTFPAGATLPEGSGADGWFKVYSSGANNWSWSTNTSDNDPHQIFAQFDAPGTYNILVSARSSSHAIDRMVLSKVGADGFSGNPQDLSLPESPLSSGLGEGPFSQPREGGYDVVTLDFDDFDQGETFSFSVDVDPNSIEGETGTGDSAVVSGSELIGTTATITYDNGETDTVTLYEDGSLGGAKAVSDTASALAAPTIELVGFADAVPDGIDGGDRQQAVVPELDQTILITGTPDAYFSLLQVDGRLVPGADGPPFNVNASELPFYANEATSGKTLYTGQLDSNGEASVPVTLLETASGDSFDDGGVNHFVAVTSTVPYADGVEVSQTSNAVVATFDPNATLGGSAILTINENANGIETSNFGNGSFSITNTGAEAINFIEIDVTDAVLVDAVFDPFGLAGDATGKLLTPGTGAAAVGLVTPTGGFDQDAIGVTYLGAGETDPILGFEKIRLEFTDFAPGETFSFGIDMDPNSIAGSAKSTLDSGAPLAGAGGNNIWDVGGVGGAELSGGLFTVGYADGGTSTGKLQGQGTGQQMGAKALSAENTAGASNVTLTVNGLGEGAEGFYGDGGPEILIQGEAGQTARVLVMKGFIVPFTNEFPDTADPDEYHDQLDAQIAALEASGFPANNAVEMLYVDVELDGTVQDISGLFDFTQVAGFDLSVPDQDNEFGVLEEDKLPLGIVASVIDPTTDLPQGDVTSPIHLTFSEDPAADLSLTKVASDINPDFGDQIVFTVTVTNDGPDAASGIEIADVLGNGFAFVQAAGSDGAYDETTGIWSIDSLETGISETLTVTATVLEGAAPTPDEVVYRINAGGATQVVGDPDATDASEPDWFGAGPVDNGAGPFAVTDGVTVAVGTDFGNDATIGNGTVPDDIDLTAVTGTDAAIEALYRTERFGDTQWEFAVDPGAYTVNLYFAEIFQGVQGSGVGGGIGDRLFDVTIEGVEVLTDYDIFEVAGGGRIATVESFDVTSDGTLDIDFTTVVDNAKISAIEIIRKGDETGQPDYTNTAEIVAVDQQDPDSTPGNGVGLGEDDEASVAVSPVAGGLNLVTIAAADPAGAEGTPPDPAQFVVSLEESAATDTVVTYTVAGTATPGADYQTLTGTVIIAAGALSAPIDITVLDDQDFEGAETVDVTLTGATGDSNVQLGAAVLASATIADDDLPPVEGSAKIEITPDGGLNASTFSGSSFQITNTGLAEITKIEFDLSTAILPDMVFDPIGAGGDATASCFTPNSGAAATGLVAPSDPCTDPFSEPRNGGFDVLTIEFTDFQQTEAFFFTTDVDPNNIQGVSGAGNAGAVSGYELIGSTVTITFSDGTNEEVVVSSLYDDGSLGGAQGLGRSTLSTGIQFAAPTIELLGGGADESASLPGDQQSVPVGDTTQTVRVTGEAGANVSLLQMDARLYIASGDDPFDVSADELPFYANEAMSGKTLYTGVIGDDGFADIPVTLLETPSSDPGPDGGINHFVAVLSDGPYAVDTPTSQTSNTVVVRQSDVVPDNTAPEITSGDSFEFVVGAAGPVLTATATDAEDDTIDFALSGTDAGDFSLDPATGAISYVGTPTFAADEVTSNLSFDLTADDGELTDIQTVSVTVLKDSDGDLVGDRDDNAINMANPLQIDSDEDGFGNVIDGDFNQDGVVDLFDLTPFAGAFGTSAPIDPNNPASGSAFDITGDGSIDLFDLNRFSVLFGQPVDVAFDYGPNA